MSTVTGGGCVVSDRTDGLIGAGDSQVDCLQVDMQFFDLAIEARQSELQPLGGLSLVRPLIEDTQDMEPFVVTERRAQVVGVR